MSNETRNIDHRDTNTQANSLSRTAAPPAFRAGPFQHHRLDAYRVALQALVLGDTIARAMPGGYGCIKDQFRRALTHAFAGVSEAAARTGADRQARFRAARGEAGEAAALLEAIGALKLAPQKHVDAEMMLLARLCAMLTRLAGFHA